MNAGEEFLLKYLISGLVLFIILEIMALFLLNWNIEAFIENKNEIQLLIFMVTTLIMTGKMVMDEVILE